MQKFRSTNGDGKQLHGRIIPLPPDIPLTFSPHAAIGKYTTPRDLALRLDTRWPLNLRATQRMDPQERTELTPSRGCLDFALNKRANIAHSDGEIVLSLQVDPELWGVGEITAKAQHRLSRDRAFAVQYIDDTADGTRNARASALAERRRAFSSRLKIRPGWIGTIAAPQ